MLIKITQEHIRRGLRCSARFCPVALGLKQALGMDVLVFHSSASVRTNPEDTFWHGRTAFFSKRTQAIITRFDVGEEIKPFNFKIDWKEESA